MMAVDVVPSIDLASPFRIGDVDDRQPRDPRADGRGLRAGIPPPGPALRRGHGLHARWSRPPGCTTPTSARGATCASPRDEHPIAVQLFGTDPVLMADAAGRCVAAGADMIDINMGCPVKKVTKTGAGLRAARRARARPSRWRAPCAEAADVPVTVKMRRGMTNGSRDCLDARRRAWSRSGRRRRSRSTRAPPRRCTPASPTTRSRPSSSSSSTCPCIASGDITDRVRGARP